MSDIPFGRFVGQVPMPAAVYRPGNARGAGAIAPHALGVAFYSPLAVLEQERDELLAEEDRIIVAADKAKKVTPGERARLDEIHVALAQKAADIAVETARREKARNEPSLGARGGEMGFAAPQLRAERRPDGEPYRSSFSGRTPYRELFGLETLDNGGFAGFEEYLATIGSGRSDPRILAATGTEGVGSEGGFLVPEEYTDLLLSGTIESEIVRPRARIFPMKSETRNVSGFDAATHTGGEIYGFTPVWMGENVTATPQKGKVARIKLTAHKVALYGEASNELTSDGTSYDEQVGDAMRASVGFTFDSAFLTGNGVAKPRGVLNDDALIAVAKEAGQAADTILWENLTKMLARLHPGLFSEAIWIANLTALPQLASLAAIVGTGGAHIPVMTTANGRPEILTRPVYWTEKLPALGNLGDIMLVAFSQYGIGLRKEFVLDTSQGPGWERDVKSYRGIVRVDGRGLWTAPVAPLNGDTLSWCVALAERA